jgi:eukaryotic-like serine/threonine-protein kinase
MKGLMRLIGEIHRRSLWQVLAVFLAAAWGVLQFVDFLTERAGLPEWTPSMALVVLLLGLPIVLATAFVQEGMSGGERGAPKEWGGTGGPGEPGVVGAPRVVGAPERLAGSEELEGMPAAGGRGVAGATGGAGRSPGSSGKWEPTDIRRLLTWRNALLGGVGALGLVGVAVAVYFVMWSTGIGPVGNLVAQGVIQQGDRVVLAAFADETGEGLGAVVTGALRVDLAQGSILSLVEETELTPVLDRMQVEAGTLLTGELAREAAVREGIGAVLDGEVARAGTGYLVTAALREAESGRSMAAFRVTAVGPDDIIPAMDRLSRDIRAKAGESLRSVRAGDPLEQVTTRSLEALRLFTEADRAFSLGDYRQTLELLEQAVAVDPGFAMAWRRMAAALNNIGTDPARERHAATQAYLNRDRLTERERYLAEAYYFSTVEQDRTRTIAAYRNVLRVASDDRVALNNLGNEYSAIEDLPRAEELYRRAVDGPGRTSTAFSNLIRVRIGMGELSGAEAAYREFEEAYPGNQELPEWAYWLAFMRNDLETARIVTAPLLDDPGLPAFVRTNALFRMALASYREGRLDDGRAYALAAERVAGEVGGAFQVVQRLWTAQVENVLGDRQWATDHVRTILADGAFAALDPDARPWFFLAISLAALGERERTERVLEEWEAHLAPRSLSALSRANLQRVRLLLDAASGRVEGTLQAMEEVAVEYGCPPCWLQDRAFAAAREGRTGEAIRFYEEVGEGGFINLSLNGTFRVQAMLVLGPLYEEAGDTTRALEAYRRVVREWANADARGMERVREAEARTAALRGGTTAAEARP